MFVEWESVCGLVYVCARALVSHQIPESTITATLMPVCLILINYLGVDTLGL